MGTELYRFFGLDVPPWKPLLVTKEFIQRSLSPCAGEEEECWMPEPGLAFGSRFLGGPGVQLLEILPGNSFRRVCNREGFWLAWLIDVCASHMDNRQAAFLEFPDRHLWAYFLDHGHLFGGPDGQRGSIYNVFASRYLDRRLYPRTSFEQLLELRNRLKSIDTGILWQRIDVLPDGWKTVSALNCFAMSIDRLGDATTVNRILDEFIENNRRSLLLDRAAPRSEPGDEVLHPDALRAEHPSHSNARRQCAGGLTLS